MRIISILLMTLLCSSVVWAEMAISLPPMKGEKALDVVVTKNVTGSCGSSIVRVLGITDVMGNFYSIDGDAGPIIIRSGPTKELVIRLGNGLSDYNGVACVSTKASSRLLVWSKCSGTACGDDFTFLVIDPERLIFLAPKALGKGLCDEKCAAQVLGNRLPCKVTPLTQQV